MNDKIAKAFEKFDESSKKIASSFEEAVKDLNLQLIVLNGGGLVATLAFMGTIIAGDHKFKFLPFYWSAVLFGLGLFFSLIVLVSRYQFLYSSTVKYMKVYQENTNKLCEELKNGKVFEDLAKRTSSQKIFSYVGGYSIIFAAAFFVSGLVSGFFYLRILLNS